MPASRSGLRVANRWKTKASISIPAPAMAHAMSAPSTPVSVPNRRGSRKTPDPIIDPTTIAVSVRRLTLSPADFCSVSVALIGPPTLWRRLLTNGRPGKTLVPARDRR
jgi:hypothetical protein